MTYNVALHPNCHITFDKSQWKNQNSGKTTEEVVSFYKYPYLKIVDYIVKKGDNTSVVFISKVKLMGFEKGKGKIPDILKNSEVEVILGTCEVVMRSREGLEQFDVPTIEICDQSETEANLKSELSYSYNMGDKENSPSLLDAVSASRYAAAKMSGSFKLSQKDLLEGDLAPLGPLGLNILAICNKCCFITYASDNKISQFKPPAKVLLANLSDILPNNQNYEFCSCNDENEQFRKEFQNKCMVVNQDTSSGSERKVQCILVSKDQKCVDHDTEDSEEGMTKLKMITNDSTDSNDDGMSKVLVPISHKVARVSSKLRLCERCGVQERDMSACKHCAKVSHSLPISNSHFIHYDDVNIRINNFVLCYFMLFLVMTLFQL